ncbi:MAG: cell division protein FtsQ/DivIB [Candidatus Pelagibacter sp.]
MHHSIGRKRIYFYLLILLFLSSTYNFNIISKFKNFILIDHINVEGLNKKEKNILEKNLKIFLKKNIFLISRDEIKKKFKNNSFLDNYNIVKVFPSKLLINAKKTEFVGTITLNQNKYYIGKNGKLTKTFLVEKENSLPQVFGKFKVNEFLKLQEILKTNGFNLSNIKKYYYFKSKRWDVESKEIVLKLPSKNIEKSLKDYRSLIKANKIMPGMTIDLRMKNKIILKNEKK